jgi:hypothetical protein
VRLTAPGAHARALAFLRSRLLGAVSLPALIGAAWAWRAGAFGPGAARLSLLRLAIALAGLAAVELMNLFGADLKRAGGAQREPGGKGPPGAGSAPLLPGNPVAPRLAPVAIRGLLLLLAGAGLAALLYFAIAVGPGVLAFLLPAAAVGALYVLSPFPYAFLGTALVPPLVAGGLSFVLTGRAPAACFLSALPVSLVSAGVILTYQVAYRGPRLFRAAAGGRLSRLGGTAAAQRVPRPGAGHGRGRLPAQRSVPGNRRRPLLGLSRLTA